MLDSRYYRGYEGEGEVRIWSGEGGNEEGLVVWAGFFDTILEGCFNQEFGKNGVVWCYYNHDGFYDDKWEMQYPYIVLEELKKFDENLLHTKDKEIIKKSKEIIGEIVSFIYVVIKDERNIYVEYG